MLYKFKSPASGDVIMLGPNGDTLLRAIGREPSAKGIIEVDAMPAAIRAIEQAVAADEAARAQASASAADAADTGTDPDSRRPAQGDGVALRPRLWPMVDMLQRALAARVAVVWGV